MGALTSKCPNLIASENMCASRQVEASSAPTLAIASFGSHVNLALVSAEGTECIHIASYQSMRHPRHQCTRRTRHCAARMFRWGTTKRAFSHAMHLGPQLLLQKPHQAASAMAAPPRSQSR